MLGLCHVQRPELCSMVACLASDLGLDAVDFELFDVKVWRFAKNRLKIQLGLTPHIALVAKAALGPGCLPWVLINYGNLVLKGAQHGNIDRRHDNYHGDDSSARDSGNAHNYKCTYFC